MKCTQCGKDMRVPAGCKSARCSDCLTLFNAETMVNDIVNDLEYPDAVDVESLVSRPDLERAWAALGFMAMCGTLRNRRLGIVLKDINAIATYRRGDLVIYNVEGGNTITIGKPMRTECLGGSGFIAEGPTMVCVPKQLVKRLDPLLKRIRETSR